MSRPVAEIIGWERHEREAAWKMDGSLAFTAVWYTPPGVIDVHGLGVTPSPDDMLAWLRAQHPNGIKIGLQDDLVGFPRDAPAGFWVERPTGTGHVSHCAPTLRAALEAAVQATDDETRR